MSLEQNTQYINVHKLLEIESNEEDKSLKESVENIFKNHMYQNDIETICECLLNQRTYIIKLRDSITEASRQLNERIMDVKEMGNYIRSLESKDTIKDIVIIFLILLSIFLILIL
jgi:predicted nucleic-acid-binding protein